VQDLNIAATFSGAYLRITTYELVVLDKGRLQDGYAVLDATDVAVQVCSKSVDPVARRAAAISLS